MAFAKLFKTLSTAEEDRAAPHPSRNGVQELCTARRPHLGGQHTDQKKKKNAHQHKQFNQAKRTKPHGPPTFYDYDNPDGNPTVPANCGNPESHPRVPANCGNPDGHPRGPANFNHSTFRHSDKKQDLLNHSGAYFQHNMDKKVQRQKIQNTPTFKQGMQQQNMEQRLQQKNNKKKKWQENGHSQSNGGGCANRRQWHQAGRSEWLQSKGRGPTKKNERHKPTPPAKPKSMTQEFKDQNAVEVDGRLVCKHFLMGRCIKGDECQLEHCNTANDQIKEVCKFYVQGCCSKGESCAYMHSSFPCKFFHTLGNCFNNDDCRFSHEPLADLTKQLLDKALQRDKDVSELAKKRQQESLAQPGTADLEVTAEEKASSPKPDVLLHPIRLNFYNSSCPAEPRSETEELITTTAHIGNTSVSGSPLSSDLCDFNSVEVVVGPMKSKPFLSLFGSMKDSTPSASPPHSPARPSVVANHVVVPYSVDAILGSVKTVESPNVTHARGPPVSAPNPPLTFYGSDPSKEVPKPPRDSGMSHDKALCLKPDVVDSTEAKTWQNGSCFVPSSNPDHKPANHHLPMDILVPPDSQSPAEGKDAVIDSNSCTYTHILPAQPETCQARDTQKAFRSLFACPLNQNELKHPPHLRPLPSAALSNPRSSVLPSPDTSSALTNGKEWTATTTDTATGHHNAQVLVTPLAHKPAPKQSAAFKVGNPGVPPGSTPQGTESHGRSHQAQTDCTVGKPAHCGPAVLGCSKPVKRSYHSGIEDSDEDLPALQIVTDLITASSDSQKPSEVEPGKAAGGVLQSLFATPIHEATAPLPPAQVKPGAIKPLPVEGRSEHHTKKPGAVASPISCPGPKRPNRKGRISGQNDQRTPTDPVQNDRDLQISEISSDKAPSNAAAATCNSVLKTLFLKLRPFCQEVEERNTHSKSGSEDGTKHCRFPISKRRTEEEQEEKETRRTTEVMRGTEPAGCLPNPDHQRQGSCEPTSQPTPPAKHWPSVQKPLSHSSEPLGGPTSGALAPGQHMSPGAQHPPVGAERPATGPPCPPAQVTSIKQPLKTLFKRLDPTASPFGS